MKTEKRVSQRAPIRLQRRPPSLARLDMTKEVGRKEYDRRLHKLQKRLREVALAAVASRFASDQVRTSANRFSIAPRRKRGFAQMESTHSSCTSKVHLRWRVKSVVSTSLFLLLQQTFSNAQSHR